MLIRQLSSWRRRTRANAAQQLQQLGPAAIVPLLAVLEQERRKRAHRRRIFGWVMLVDFLCMVSLIAWWLFSGTLLRKWSEFPSETLRLIFYAWGSFSVFLAPSRLQRQVTRVLLHFDSVEAVGPLIDALEFDASPFLKTALTRLLPRLKASDAHLLDVERRKRLYVKLQFESSFTDAEFLIAIMRALEQVGDAAALPYVESWANRYVTSANGVRVRAAARHCLPFLQERAAQEHVSAHLLRPSASPAATSESLLRPAEASEDTPDQLLRAASAETHSEEGRRG